MGFLKVFVGVSRKFQRSFKGVLRGFQGSFQGVSVKFQWCFKRNVKAGSEMFKGVLRISKGVSGKFQELINLKGLPSKFQGSFKDVSRMFMDVPWKFQVFERMFQDCSVFTGASTNLELTLFSPCHNKKKKKNKNKKNPHQNLPEGRNNQTKGLEFCKCT